MSGDDACARVQDGVGRDGDAVLAGQGCGISDDASGGDGGRRLGELGDGASRTGGHF